MKFIFVLRSPYSLPRMHRRRVEVQVHSFFIFGARWGGWLRPRPSRFTIGNCVGGWVGTRESERVRKISPLPGFEPRTVQHIASRHTDWDIPAPHICTLRVFKLRCQYESLNIKRLDVDEEWIEKTRGRNGFWHKVRDYAVLCPEGLIKTTKHSYRTFSILTEIRTRHLPKRIRKLFRATCSERIWNAPSLSPLKGLSWNQPEYILKLHRSSNVGIRTTNSPVRYTYST